MSKTMTTNPGQIAVGDLDASGKGSSPAEQLLESIGAHCRGSSTPATADSRRSQTKCLVLFRAVRRGDHCFDP